MSRTRKREAQPAAVRALRRPFMRTVVIRYQCACGWQAREVVVPETVLIGHARVCPCVRERRAA